MNRDILAGIISFSLIFIYNGLLKTNLAMKWVLTILGILFGISLLLASGISLPFIKWAFSLKKVTIFVLFVFALIVIYKNQKKVRAK